MAMLWEDDALSLPQRAGMRRAALARHVGVRDDAAR